MKRSALFAFIAVMMLSVSPAIAIGGAAPDFSLQDLAGKTTTLSDVTNGKKAVLLNFWATWCPSCREEIPELSALNKDLSALGFAVIGIDVGESQKRVSSFVAKLKIDYPVLLDADSKTAEDYAVVGLPVSVLLDANGKVIGEYSEYSDKLKRDVENALK